VGQIGNLPHALSEEEYTMRRREFINALGGGVVALGAPRFTHGAPQPPSYLKGYESLYAKDPRAAAAKQNANLLLNTGPLPDGSTHAGDEATLREVGRRLKQGGFPPTSANN